MYIRTDLNHSYLKIQYLHCSVSPCFAFRELKQILIVYQIKISLAWRLDQSITILGQWQPEKLSLQSEHLPMGK